MIAALESFTRGISSAMFSTGKARKSFQTGDATKETLSRESEMDLEF